MTPDELTQRMLDLVQATTFNQPDQDFVCIGMIMLALAISRLAQPKKTDVEYQQMRRYLGLEWDEK